MRAGMDTNHPFAKMIAARDQHDELLAKEAELVDEIAGMANPGKYTWSESDKAEMLIVGREILAKVRGFYFGNAGPARP